MFKTTIDSSQASAYNEDALILGELESGLFFCLKTPKVKS